MDELRSLPKGKISLVPAILNCPCKEITLLEAHQEAIVTDVTCTFKEIVHCFFRKHSA